MCGNINWWARYVKGIMSSWHGKVIIHPVMSIVYRKSKLVVKWDLENQQPMEGKASRRLLQLIEELDSEGKL
ncbi:MAG: hypothetical protein V3R68_08795 [Gammaproteobacteria bacterium]